MCLNDARDNITLFIYSFSLTFRKYFFSDVHVKYYPLIIYITLIACSSLKMNSHSNFFFSGFTGLLISQSLLKTIILWINVSIQSLFRVEKKSLLKHNST